MNKRFLSDQDELITIIIPAYNAEKYIRESVESALAQPETGEVILVDDASPDQTLQICQELAKMHPKVRVLHHADGKNHGAGASRNLAIKNAVYDLVAFLDADDFYLPDRFKVAKDIFKESSEIDGIYEAVGTHFQNKDSEKKWWSMRKKEGFVFQNDHILTTIKESVEPEVLLEAFTTQNIGWFHGNGLVVRKHIFKRTGYFSERLELSQDIEMWTKMMAVGRLVPGRLDVPVAMRRVHGHNRILASKEKVNYYNLLSWRYLFEWGHESNLELSKLNLILNKYIKVYVHQYRRGRIIRIATQIYLAIKLPVQYPWILQLDEFRKYVVNLPFNIISGIIKVSSQAISSK